MTTQPQLTQANLLDTLIAKLNLKNDAQLAVRLDVGPPVISKLRSGKLKVGASILLSMHEESGMPTKELRALMGDFRPLFGVKVK
jgi:hypothetical protein